MDPHLRCYLNMLQVDEKPLTKKVDTTTHTTTIVNSKEKQETTTVKNNAVVNALGKLLHASFRNVPATGRRIMISIDLLQPQMSKPTFGTKTVNCLEAAAIIALTFVKAEKDVTVANFNGENINIVQIAKGIVFI